MAVSIRLAELALVQVKPGGEIIRRGGEDSSSLREHLRFDTEFRILDNTSGPSAAPNSGGFPTLATYLEAEAADDHALAYLDQNKVITQMIT